MPSSSSSSSSSTQVPPPPLAHDDDKEMDVDVDDLQQRGNHEFQQGHVENAIAFYSAAIQHSKPGSSSSIVNLCNRSACYFQMEDYEQALTDAKDAWNSSQHSNIKAAYRLAKTLVAMNQYETAIEILQTALTIPELSETEVTSFQDLFQQATQQQQKDATTSSTAIELTIKGVQRPISIREFIKEPNQRPLGVGNFSEVIVVTHKVTNEVFALKVLEKKQAADLAKRQHVSCCSFVPPTTTVVFLLLL
jgi:tetratricopeptide (TPR) repeat protein